MRPGSLMEGHDIFRREEGDEAGSDGEESLIDASSTFDGLFQTSNHLRIEGQAKGEIQCQGTLTVADGATVTAKITAANVLVAGAVSGEVVCRERLQILPSGRVSGTVTTNSLVIQEGALYEGELRMRTAPADTRPQPSAGRTGPGRGRATANGRGEAAAAEESN